MDIATIQLQKVDNGFLLQGVNVDGAGKSVRMVAMSREDLVKAIGLIAEDVFTKEAPGTTLPPPESGPSTQENAA